MTDDLAILIPTYNEAPYIRLILSLARRAAPDAWIIVCDGGSHDLTIPKLIAAMTQDPKIIVLRNSGQYQSCGLNTATALAQKIGARYALRLDAHAHYTLTDLRRAVRLITDGRTDLLTCARHVALPPNASQWQHLSHQWDHSRFAALGAPFRAKHAPQSLGHGHHIGWRVAAFLDVGGYRPDLAACEDLELETRLTRAGYDTQFDRHITAYIYPRVSWDDMCRQLYRNGNARVSAFGIKAFYALRMWIPFAAIVLGLLCLTLLPLLTLTTLAALLWLSPKWRIPTLGIIAFCLGALSASFHGVPRRT